MRIMGLDVGSKTVGVAISDPVSYTHLVTAISYIAAGLLFSLLYLRKDKNIWYPIALHCSNNIIAFIITLLTINK